MRARTERERKVEVLSDLLPSLTDEQKDEAYHCYGYAYVGKKRGWCSVCGHEIPLTDEWPNKRRKVAVCPHCGARLEIRRSPQKETSHEKYYYTILNVVDGWQVIRNFICDRSSGCRQKLAGITVEEGHSCFEITEVSRCWIDNAGVPIFYGRSVGQNPWYYDVWRLDSPLQLRHEHDRYKTTGYLGKGSKLLPQIRKRGLKTIRKGYGVYYQMIAVLHEPKMETLAKAGQWKIFEYCCQDCYYYLHHIRTYWNQIKIAIRWKYRVDDAGLWFDHLRMLEDEGKDIHNPKFVCPENLLKEHRKLIAIRDARYKKIDQERKEKEERELVEKLKADSSLNVEYRERIGDLLSFEAKKNNITLRPLQDIKDFFEEANALHHCVYANHYYDHEDCLIIGAKVSGRRMETIEINTRTWNIIQCRGKYNRPSPFHDKIMRLATDSLPRLRKCL